MTDFETVRAVNTGAILQSGHDLQSVSTTQLNGNSDYIASVTLPVQAGEIWSDAAQPDAYDVVHATARAFETASTLLTSAATVCVTFSIELDAAKAALDEAVKQAKNIFTVSSSGEVLYVGDVPGESRTGEREERRAQIQQWIDLAVRRATDADEACSRALREISDTSLVLSATASPGLRDRANEAADAAVELYSRVLQLQERLAGDAQQAAEDLALEQDGFWGHVAGFFQGLWGGVAGLWELGDLVNRASDGDPEAIAQLGTLVDEFEAGDLIALDALQDGRYGEFLGTNAWWFIPLGKIGTVAGKGGAAAVRTARQALTEARAVGAAGRGGRAPVPGEAWGGSGKTAQELTDAGKVPAKGGVERSVQELDKHAKGQRSSGDKFPPLKGGPAEKLATAQAELQKIVTDPRAREVPITAGKFNGGHYYITPDGRGAAFDASGNFQYFGEFTYPG